MCTVSSIGDNYRDNFPHRWPSILSPEVLNPTRSSYTLRQDPPITYEDFQKLKAEVEELRQLLMAAKKFDEETKQPDCEMDEKVAFIKKLAEYVGVDMKEVFK